MRILHVIPSLTVERGGPSTVVAALSRQQAAAGHQVTILTTDQGERRGEHSLEVSAGVEVRRTAVWGSDRLACAPGFSRAVREGLRHSDVLHVHSIFTFPVHAALREAVTCGFPVVLRPCGHLHRYSLQHSCGRKALYLELWGGLIRRACSVWHYTSAQEAAGSWPYERVPGFVLPNGIQPEEFSNSITLGSLPPVSGPYVVFLGRLHAKKRVDLLVEAFLAAAPRKYRLVVAGPDPDGIWARVSARFGGDPGFSRVVRLATVIGPAKAALLAGASLFALPSEHENFGVAALEALACGTPVLLSPHVDVGQSAQAAGLGWIAPLEVQAWCGALAGILSGGDELKDREPACRAWAVEGYSWSKISSRLEAHYRSLLGGTEFARIEGGARNSPKLHLVPRQGNQV